MFRYVLSSNSTTNKNLQKLTLNLLQIWGAAAGVSPGPSDLVWNSQKSWGSGYDIGVTLVTDEGEVSEFLASSVLIQNLFALTLECSWW